MAAIILSGVAMGLGAMDDDRVAPRYDINVEVELTHAETSDAFQGTTHDLSESGVRLFVDRIVAKGTLLELEFPTFSCTGEVIWTREAGDEPPAQVGMKFVSLSSDDRQKLRRLLQSPKAVKQPAWTG